MKRLYTIFALFATITTSAQDILYKTSGEQIQVKVLEVSKTDVKYKLTSNLEGPDYVLPKEDVFMVEYANGSKDVFATDNKTKSDSVLATSKKEMTELEKLYRRRKGGGIAGTIIGSVGVAVTTALFADGMLTIRSSTGDKKDKAEVQAITSGAFFVAFTIGLAAGIDNLVKASVIKTRLNKGEVSIEPKILNDYSFQGREIRQNNGFGVGIVYGF